MNEIYCPECGMKLPILVQDGYLPFMYWCRSKGCRGRWVKIDTRQIVTVN